VLVLSPEDLGIKQVVKNHFNIWRNPIFCAMLALNLRS
jgi:hypothetical protein